MTKRKIVKIDEERCTGCGLCIPNCAEGALQIVDGKARLVKEIYCDGLGACLGHCPEDAISIEERDAAMFDEKATQRHLEEIKKKEKGLPCGCPGTAVQSFKKQTATQERQATRTESELTQWPIQLMLVPVTAPYLRNADLLIAADCVPFSYADFHQDLLKGKALLIGCPKLDAATVYEEKLAEIIKANDLKGITVVHMEVPCCFGLKGIVSEAVRISGRRVPVREITVGIRGEIIN